MASKGLLAVFAALLVIQVSSNVVPKSESNFNALVDIVKSALVVAQKVANEIKNNSNAIDVGMHELVSQEVRPVSEIVSNNIDKLVQNATDDKTITCLNEGKHKVEGFVNVAVQQSTECVLPHFNTIPDQLEPIVSGLEGLVAEATKLAETWANCKNSPELCELSFCLNTFRMLANAQNSKFSEAAKAVWNAEVEITTCLNNGNNGVKGQLQTVYEDSTKC